MLASLRVTRVVQTAQRNEFAASNSRAAKVVGWGRLEPEEDGLARSLRSLRELRLPEFKSPVTMFERRTRRFAPRDLSLENGLGQI
jgi:hypothetical protein